MRSFTAGIVADAITHGPLVQPPPPSLTVTPDTARGPADSPLGPFTVNADPGTTVTVTAAGAGTTMSTDAARTVPIANNSTVPPGQQIWLSATDPGASEATLSARAPRPCPPAPSSSTTRTPLV